MMALSGSFPRRPGRSSRVRWLAWRWGRGRGRAGPLERRARDMPAHRCRPAEWRRCASSAASDAARPRSGVSGALWGCRSAQRGGFGPARAHRLPHGGRRLCSARAWMSQAALHRDRDRETQTQTRRLERVRMHVAPLHGILRHARTHPELVPHRFNLLVPWTSRVECAKTCLPKPPHANRQMLDLSWE